ncbi:MAG: hypothetical protein IKF38_02065 [Clostridia bacterium]|nr:hypothetical protein [Clostridia bacterium]
MEEKRLKKISTKKTIVIITLIMAIILGIILFAYDMEAGIHSSITEYKGKTCITKIYADTGKQAPINSNITYKKINASLNQLSGDYRNIKLENIFINSNTELKKYLFECFGKDYENIKIDNQNILKYFDKKFFDNNKLAIFMNDNSYTNHKYTMKSVIKNKSTAIINLEDSYSAYGGVLAFNISLDCYVFDKSIDNVQFDIYQTTHNNRYTPDKNMFLIMFGITTISIIIIVTMFTTRHNKTVEGKLEKMNLAEKVLYCIISITLIIVALFTSIMAYESLLQYNTASYKPIIYLYPTKETDVSVNLKNTDMITVSYPKYNNGWNVNAKKDGTLVDLETNRSLYSLYYECNNVVNYKVENEGFVINGEDSAKFLEEKLAILGLNEREAEEFIIYWLPKLEANKYNYIRFASEEEINQNMPLEITPKPDITIRIMMTFKGLEKPIQVKEQKLEQVERNGFVAVEWGGSEIK